MTTAYRVSVTNRANGADIARPLVISAGDRSEAERIAQDEGWLVRAVEPVTARRLNPWSAVLWLGLVCAALCAVAKYATPYATDTGVVAFMLLAILGAIARNTPR